MNRRSFIVSMLKAAVASAVLPAATTYARAWKPLASGILAPVDAALIGVTSPDIGHLSTHLILMRNLEYLKAELGIMRSAEGAW